MKQNLYEIEKNVEKVFRHEATGFLTSSVRASVAQHLKRIDFNTFIPFPEADKVILYSGNEPKIHLFRIICHKDQELKHSTIMGSLFGLGITGEMFGDIVWHENYFYVYILDSVCELVKKEFRTAGNISIRLEEMPVDFLKDFKRKYEKIELIVSSLRIDTVIARLIGCTRDVVFDKIRDKEIYINDIAVKKASGVFNIGDIFSIRRVGKFRFTAIGGKTKKDNLIILIDKFI